MADWKPYSDIPAGSDSLPLTGSSLPDTGVVETGVCVECGGSFPKADMVAYSGNVVCENCRDIYFQKIREGVAPTAAMVYAGFWIRFVAKIVDGIILFVANTAISIIGALLFTPVMMDATDSGGDSSTAYIFFQLAMMFVQMAVGAAYGSFFIGRFGATPGKMAVGIRVIRPDGSSVSYLRALGRVFAEYLSSLILLIGYIMAGFDEEKRSLHDRICDTRVVRN
jgi:uncharacterized RDD family membrane protein YckC